MAPSPGPAVIEWGVAARPLPGESTSGDHRLVQSFPGGILVAAVDGLGHGPEAAQAADVAVETLSAHVGQPVLALVERCHQALRHTRGVAISLASFDLPEQTLTWLGVGNVEGVLWRADPNARPAREYLIQRGGVVGYQMPPLRAEVLALHPRDLLLFATDGIQADFAESVVPADPPQQIADAVLARHARETDDALVLVARYLGGT